MKIILSRKGFDSGSGGIPSPILPDRTLLSLPIPEDMGISYDEIIYNGRTYKDIIDNLNNHARNQLSEKHKSCHLDPDIRSGVRKKNIDGWKPAFGQHGAAATQLMNCNVNIGDVFLFFGRFRWTEKRDDKLRFVHGCPDVQIIFGYMEIAEILKNQKDIEKYDWHPHAGGYGAEKNILFLPSEKLTINPNREGYGLFNYAPCYQLTLDKKSAATWKEYSFLQPNNLCHVRKNKSKGEGIYYQGQWQELVLKENEAATEWLRSLFD